jgi:hypothetical protein
MTADLFRYLRTVSKADVTEYFEAANDNNFDIGQTRTMTLLGMCKNPAIGAGEIVQLKVGIRAC